MDPHTSLISNYFLEVRFPLCTTRRSVFIAAWSQNKDTSEYFKISKASCVVRGGCTSCLENKGCLVDKAAYKTRLHATTYNNVCCVRTEINFTRGLFRLLPVWIGRTTHFLLLILRLFRGRHSSSQPLNEI